jgi:quercetin dioxygenase-like cupin family protein
MKPVRTLKIFGERLEILVDGTMTEGASTMLVQESSPGSGPPPHRHTKEDEIFTVLEGEYELLSEGQWHRAPVGEIFFAPRGKVHTFRNVGETTGRIAVFVSPAGLEHFFAKLDGLSPATDLKRILELFEEYGLSLQTP